MSTVDDLIRDYEPDVEWITALWLAIHGAKPGEQGHVEVRIDEATALLATALSARLSEAYGLGPDYLGATPRAPGLGGYHHRRRR